MKKLILIAIIVLAFALRFYRLDSFPALNADEAAIGYNAYSLIQTGKDEHGHAWPIHFQSFNDYKPGLYFYLVLPFIKILGLNELAVRLPNAILSVATVLVVYFLVKELFKKDSIALTSALFLAISPWHIHFSRGGWEANTATFFITTGIWLFIKSINSNFKRKYLILSILAFVASLYAYHAARVIVPLLGIGLFVIYRKNLIKNLKPTLIAVVIGLILLIPLLIDFTKGGVLSRAAGVGLFADPGPRSRVEEQRGEHGNITSILAKSLHNKAVNYSLAFFENWGKHYWGEFLFLSGDEVQRNKVPETGEMYLFDVILLPIGIIILIKGFKRERDGVIILWLVIAPVASALTFQAPGALRAENMVIPLMIISAIGLITIVEVLSKRKYRNVIFGILFLIISWQFARYLHMYYVHMSKEYPYSSQYGVKELVNYISQHKEKYKKILVTDRYDQPYILFLFYTKYDPAKFQSDHQLTPRDQFGFSTVNHFGRYYFASIKFDEAKPDNPNSLIVGTNGEIPKEANIVKDIYGTNGFLYFRVVAN